MHEMIIFARQGQQVGRDTLAIGNMSTYEAQVQTYFTNVWIKGVGAAEILPFLALDNSSPCGPGL